MRILEQEDSVLCEKDAQIEKLKQSIADDAMLRKQGAGLLADMLNPNGGLTIKQLPPKTTEQHLEEKITELAKVQLELNEARQMNSVHEQRIAELENRLALQNKPIASQSTTKLSTKEEDNLVSILHILCSMQRIDLSNQTQTYIALETHARTNRLTVPSKNTVIKFLKMTGYSPSEDS